MISYSANIIIPQIKVKEKYKVTNCVFLIEF